MGTLGEVRVGNGLNEAGAVSEVNEGHASMVAPAMGPTCELDGLTDMARP